MHRFTIGPANYAPRVQIWGKASGDYGGFPFAPWKLTSGKFSARGKVDAELRTCQEVRLANYVNECIGSDLSDTPVARACDLAGGSRTSMHIDSETNNIVLLQGTSSSASLRCLSVDFTRSVSGKFRVGKAICSSGRNEMQQWNWLSDGTLRPIGAGTYCLAADAERASTVVDFRGRGIVQMPMVVRSCSGGNSQRWRFY